MTKCRLSPVALGLALGSLGVLAVVAFGIVTFLGINSSFVQVLHKMHEGVEQTLAGFGLAALISFLCGFVHGFFIGWLYNAFANCCCCNKGNAHCNE